MERQAATGTGLPPSPTASEALNAPNWNGTTTCPFDMAGAPTPSQIAVTAAERASPLQKNLVSIRHDDAHDEWAHLCSLSLYSSCVTIKPTIFYGGGMTAGQRSKHPTQGTTQPGDSGNVPAGPYLTSVCMTRMPGPMATRNPPKFLNAPPPRRNGNTNPPASSGDGTSLLWSTPLTASPPKTLTLHRSAWPASSPRNGAALTQRWTRMSHAIARSTTLLLHGDRTHSLTHRVPTDGVAANSCPAIQLD
ncbi:LOW QUALITY PROTEIN: hypothetical protein ACHAW6_003702 [Cyclotella cf. meneghiniana]